MCKSNDNPVIRRPGMIHVNYRRFEIFGENVLSNFATTSAVHVPQVADLWAIHCDLRYAKSRTKTKDFHADKSSSSLFTASTVVMCRTADHLSFLGHHFELLDFRIN